MFLSLHMPIPLTFPNFAPTNSTINFNLTIRFLFLFNIILHIFAIVLIHFPNLLRIFLCPFFRIPQANITCSIFPPIQFQYSPTSTFPTSFFVFLIFNHYTYRITIKHSTLHSCSMQYTSFVPVPAPPLQSTITCSTFNFHILLYYTTIPLSIGRMKGKENPLIQFYFTISTPPQNPLTQF